MQQWRIPRGGDVGPASSRIIRSLPGEEEVKRQVDTRSNLLYSLPLSPPRRTCCCVAGCSHGAAWHCPAFAHAWDALPPLPLAASLSSFKTCLGCHHLEESVLTPQVEWITLFEAVSFLWLPLLNLRNDNHCFNSTFPIYNKRPWEKSIYFHFKSILCLMLIITGLQ